MKNYFSRLLLAAILCAPFTISAQVTIGSNRAPSPWSVLDLCTREQQRALHNARMDTEQRNALMSDNLDYWTEEEQLEAQGLLIFNTDPPGCLEFWSGSRWVSLCEGDVLDPCEGLANITAHFCAGSGATIRQLNEKVRAAGSRAEIRWFASATGGEQLPTTHVLVGVRYYADNCVGAAARTPVPVSFVNCARIDGGRIAAFVNVMYDFQNQTLEAFTNAGGEAISWQWQMSVRIGGTSGTWSAWENIPGANSPNFTIPANFMYDTVFDNHPRIPQGTNEQAPNAAVLLVNGHRTNTVEIRFQSIMHNPNTPNGVVTSPLEILFIRTNTSGFGGSGNERFLVVNRAHHNNDNSKPNTIRLALLNLGASNNIDDGSGGMGNFFQWGRRADGHERIVWRFHFCFCCARFWGYLPIRRKWSDC